MSKKRDRRGDERWPDKYRIPPPPLPVPISRDNESGWLEDSRHRAPRGMRNEWVLGVNREPAGGVTFINSSAQLSFRISYFGSPVTVTCNIEAGAFHVTLPPEAPGAPPGLPINIPLTPPDVLGGMMHTYGTCTDDLSEREVTVTTEPGWPWLLTLATPFHTPPRIPSPMYGDLGGYLVIPTSPAGGTVKVICNALAGVDGEPGTLRLPVTEPLMVSVIYSSASGLVSDFEESKFELDNVECPQAATPAVVTSTKITLVQASTTLHPTLVWQ